MDGDIKYSCPHKKDVNSIHDCWCVPGSVALIHLETEKYHYYQVSEAHFQVCKSKNTGQI